MKLAFKCITCVLVVFFIASCAAPTTLSEKTYQLTSGVTTIDQAISIMGSPKARSSVGAGGTLLQWMETRVGYMSANVAHVAILFDSSGKMVKITHEYRSDP